MTEAKVEDFYDKMVEAGVVAGDIDWNILDHHGLRQPGRRHGPEDRSATLPGRPRRRAAFATGAAR